VREPQLFVEPLSQTMIDARRSHQQRIEQVRDAIREQRLELYAQRIVTLNSDREELSYEVLTRLRQRDGKLMMPPEFIPLTIQAQMSVALDRSVVQKTFEWLGRSIEHQNVQSICRALPWAMPASPRLFSRNGF
jgi:EAL domain-containing protein (putative c-di-GMP-specific phosphodiesterase class I)